MRLDPCEGSDDFTSTECTVKAIDSVSNRPRYVLTELGRAVLDEEPRCLCEIRLQGVILECVNCGTVYGSLRETQFATASF